MLLKSPTLTTLRRQTAESDKLPLLSSHASNIHASLSLETYLSGLSFCVLSCVCKHASPRCPTFSAAIVISQHGSPHTAGNGSPSTFLFATTEGNYCIELCDDIFKRRPEIREMRLCGRMCGSWKAAVAYILWRCARHFERVRWCAVSCEVCRAVVLSGKSGKD
jgi:hypothetical protein